MKSTIKSKKRRDDAHRNTPLVAVLIVCRLFAFPTPSRIEPGPALYASEVNVLRVPRDYNTIQAAVEAADAGDMIRVAAGVYNETLATAGLRLYAGSCEVIDGAGLTGREMPVAGTAARLVADVGLLGSEVRDSRPGIGVRLASQARIRGNEVRHNMKWSGAEVAPDRGMGINLSGLPLCLTPHSLDDLPDHNLWERYARKRRGRRNRREGKSNLAKRWLSIMQVKQGRSRA